MTDNNVPDFTPKQRRLLDWLVSEVGNELGLATEESLAGVRAACARALYRAGPDQRRPRATKYRDELRKATR